MTGLLLPLAFVVFAVPSASTLAQADPASSDTTPQVARPNPLVFPQHLLGSCDITVPQFSEAGIYTLYATILDRAGNYTEYVTAADFDGIANRATVGVISPPDIDGPEIISISGIPETVDVSSGLVPLHLTAEAHDATTGVAEIRMQFVPAIPGAVVGDCVVFPPLFTDPPLSLTGSCDIGFPGDAPAGIYNLVATTTDRIGNVRSYIVGQLAGIANREFTTVVSTPP
jgi:hypothetical protein